MTPEGVLRGHRKEHTHHRRGLMVTPTMSFFLPWQPPPTLFERVTPVLGGGLSLEQASREETMLLMSS